MELETACQTVLQSCPVIRARTTARLLSRYLEAALRPSGLSPEQFSLLAGIAGGPGRTLKQLAQMTGHDLSTLSRTLKPLVRDGLVRSIPDPADKRRRDLRLTVRGELKLEQAIELWQQAINALPKTDAVIERTV